MADSKGTHATSACWPIVGSGRWCGAAVKEKPAPANQRPYYPSHDIQAWRYEQHPDAISQTTQPPNLPSFISLLRTSEFSEGDSLRGHIRRKRGIPKYAAKKGAVRLRVERSGETLPLDRKKCVRWPELIHVVRIRNE